MSNSRGGSVGVRGENAQVILYRKPLSSLRTVVIVLFLASVSATAAELSPARRIWAVVVGVSQYQSSSIPDLQFPLHDAQAFYRFLRSEAGLNVPADQIVLLLNEAATVTAIRSALGDFIAKHSGQDDTVLFFFAGHGGIEVDFIADGSPERAKFLLVHDTSPDQFYGTALNMKDDLAYIFHNRVQSKRILCFLDCCYAGAAQGIGTRSILGRGIAAATQMHVNLVTPLQDITLPTGEKQMLVATACGPNETAQELSSLQHGVFTHVMLEALAGKADNNRDQAVSASEFTRYVGIEVAKRTKDQQHPVLNSTLTADYVLHHYRGAVSLPAYTGEYKSSGLWQPAEEQQNKAAVVFPTISQFIQEEDYLAEIRQEQDCVLIAVIGSVEKTDDILQALRDARQKQRDQIRKFFRVGPEAAEEIYRKGEVRDARELSNRAWYLVMKYPR